METGVTMIVLHHYATSPWAEVVRLMLGLKGLAWTSVEVPMVMPKPDLQRLTGGYARVPVLQIGADLHCDTAAIADALEAHAPHPTLFPAGADHRAIAARAQGAPFFAAVGAALEAAPAQGLEAFWADRAARFGMQQQAFAEMAPALVQQFEAHLDGLEAELADGRSFLGGAEPGHGDFAHYQLLWFQDAVGAGALRFTAIRPHLTTWMRRVATIGHGRPTHGDAADALRIATEATPGPIDGGVDPASGFKAGQPVAVAQAGCRDAPVTGPLLALDDRRIVVAHRDGEAGALAVHFPRLGQILSAA
jgi:glutathione S-transferase